MDRRDVRQNDWLRTAVAGVLVAALGALASVVVSCRTAPAPAWDRYIPLPAEPEVRVRVIRGATGLELAGPWLLSVGLGEGKRTLVRTPVKVASESGSMVFLGADGERVVFGPEEAEADVSPMSSPDRLRPITVGGVGYPDRVRVSMRDDGTLDVINIVPMERYLVGVLAKELYATWPLTAFQVQAVCARTYALHSRERALVSGRAFDVEGTATDQVYDGAAELPVATMAARTTRGLVLTWRGRLLRAYYASTCGGRPASAAEIWPTGPRMEFNRDGPLQARPRTAACQESPLYRWVVDRETMELSDRLRAWGQASGSPIAAVTTIRSVAVTARGATGRPTRFAITDERNRRFEIGAEELRIACNYDAPGRPQIGSAERVNSSDVEVSVLGPIVRIEGRGFGHGVGMCQFCAKGFSDRGMGWREQLELFYSGALVQRAY